MLTHRKTTVIFALLFIAAIIWVWQNQAHYFILVVLPALLLTINIIQSFRICAQYYVTSICRIPPNAENAIYLTFDDGPSANIPEILVLLKKYGARATFFLTGKNMEAYPELTRQIAAEGHLIGNHSYSHSHSFALQSVKKIVAELRATNRILRTYNDQKPHIFRPPAGITNPLIRRALQKVPMPVIGWSVRSLDTLLNKEQAVKRVTRHLSPGDIVLLHDRVKDAPYILERILIYLQSQNMHAASLHLLVKEFEKE